MSYQLSVKNKRDILLVTVLFVILGGVFILFRLFAFQTAASSANVYYGTSTEPLVTIDFVNYRVIENGNQTVPSAYQDIYPIIDETHQTITVLGDYEVNGVRQIVVIAYDYGARSVQIIQEQSPHHICSLQGVSTGYPLICLPNRVRVEFDATNVDFTV